MRVCVCACITVYVRGGVHICAPLTSRCVGMPRLLRWCTGNRLQLVARCAVQIIEIVTSAESLARLWLPRSSDWKLHSSPRRTEALLCRFSDCIPLRRFASKQLHPPRGRCRLTRYHSARLWICIMRKLFLSSSPLSREVLSFVIYNARIIFVLSMPRRQLDKINFNIKKEKRKKIKFYTTASKSHSWQRETTQSAQSEARTGFLNWIRRECEFESRTVTGNRSKGLQDQALPLPSRTHGSNSYLRFYERLGVWIVHNARNRFENLSL